MDANRARLQGSTGLPEQGAKGIVCRAAFCKEALAARKRLTVVGGTPVDL